MAMTVQDIINEVSQQLNDVDLITWDLSSHIEYINSAMEMIVKLRPDAYSVIATMQLAAGAKQDLPAAALRLIDIKRNMGTDGVTPGSPVFAVQEEDIDLFEFTSGIQSQQQEVYNFSYDERTPNYFYVDPPSDGTGYIELSYSRVPTKVDDVDDTLVLKDIYRNAIVQWCMFRAYSIEVDSASSQRRAKAHEGSFYQMMGVKFQRDVQYSPSEEVRESAASGE